MNNKTICCIGAGYIGGPTMCVMANKNPDKTFYVVDINKDRIDAWNSNDLPIYEPGLDEQVKNVRGKNLFFSADIKECIAKADIIFVGVNTPTKTFGEGAGFASDLQYWESSAREIAQYANGDKIVVEKSTLPVKTAEAIERILKTQSSYRFQVLSNPEFLAEGTAIRDLLNPDRVLIGGHQTPEGQEAISLVSEIYKSWVPTEKIITSNLWSSELSKLAANAMLAQRVSSINSIACICEETGADITDVAHVLRSDSRIGNKFLNAGPGFGGSCFKKDILNMIYLCRTYGLNDVADYWHQVVLMNDFQQKRIVKRLLKNSFNTLANKKVCVLGYAFKADTGDIRETPAKNVVNELIAEHTLEIVISDPKAIDNAVKFDFKAGQYSNSVLRYEHNPYDAAANADIVIVLTDWNEYKDIDWNKMYNVMSNQKTVYDARNFLDHDKLKAIGFDVLVTGRTI